MSRPAADASFAEVAAAAPVTSQPLPAPLAAEYEAALGADLSDVRLHTGGVAGWAAARLGVQAASFGDEIAVAPGHYAPQTAAGRRLIAHEVVHTQQQRPGLAPPALGHGAHEAEAERLAQHLGASAAGVALQTGIGLAFAIDHYIGRSVADDEINNLSITELQQDIDEIAEYLDRQLEGTVETAMLRTLSQRMQARIGYLLSVAANDPPPPREAPRKRGRGRRQPETGVEETPAEGTDPAELASFPPDVSRMPRILRERTSIPIEDPSEVREEIDRIVDWLHRDDVDAADRALLREEFATLAPQREQARQAEAAERQTQRLRRILRPSGGSRSDLKRNLEAVEGIHIDPGEPDAAFIHFRGERHRIGVQQAEEVRAETMRELNRGIQRVMVKSSAATELYDAQREINRDMPVVHFFVDLFGGDDEPVALVARSQAIVNARLAQIRQLMRDGEYAALVDPLAEATEHAAKLEVAVKAWQHSLIDTASITADVLTVVRDVSWAVWLAIGAVLAAPLVAGAVAGAGATGTLATGLTLAGETVLLGTVSGGAGYGAEFVGQVAAGEDASVAHERASVEGWNRAIEGGTTGLGGGVTRVAGATLRVGGQVGNQTLRRGASQFLGDATAGTVSEVAHGRAPGEAVVSGLTQGGLGVVGPLAGSRFNNPMTRQAVDFVASGTATGSYILSQGGDTRDVLETLTTQAATRGVTADSPGLQRLRNRAEAVGYDAGTRVRGWSGSAARRGRGAVAGIGLGIADADPAFRMAHGGTSPEGPVPISAPASPQPLSTPPQTAVQAPSQSILNATLPGAAVAPSSDTGAFSSTAPLQASFDNTVSAQQPMSQHTTPSQSVAPQSTVATPASGANLAATSTPSATTLAASHGNNPHAPAAQAPHATTQNEADFSDINQQLGLSAPVASAPATAAQRAQGLPAAARAQAEAALANPTAAPVTAPGRLESTGARPRTGGSSRNRAAVVEQEAMGFLVPGSHDGAMASARTRRSITTAIRADTAEAMTYHARLKRGEIGLLAPVGSNIPGPDSATAVRLPNGDYEIVVIDTKSRVSQTRDFGRVRTTLPASWQNAVNDALAPGRLNLGDPQTEQQIRAAWNANPPRVRIARDTVDFSGRTNPKANLDN